MKKLISSDFLLVRLLVGYPGEKDQFNWWPTTFICSFSNHFLSPVFPRTTLLLDVQVFLKCFNFNRLKFNKKASFSGFKKLTC